MSDSRIILVTGGNQGIGFETVRQLAQQGHTVYLGARNEERGKEAITKLQQEDKLNNVRFVQLDVTDDASVAAAVAAIDKEHGRLDVLVNNAGVVQESLSNAASADLSIVKTTFDTNFFGVIRVTVGFVPLLKRSSNPVITNITSHLGSSTLQSTKEGNSFYQYQIPGYNTSKAALNHYTITLAYDFAEARVNCINPGYTKTQMSGFRGNDPKEVAAGLIEHAILLSKDGPTGQYLEWNGKINPW